MGVILGRRGDLQFRVIGSRGGKLDQGGILLDPVMERFVVPVGFAGEVVGRENREVIPFAVRVVGAHATEEVWEAEGNSSGVVDGFHAGQDGLANLTFELFINEVADGLARSRGEDVATRPQGGFAFVLLLFLRVVIRCQSVGRGVLGILT